MFIAFEALKGCLVGHVPAVHHERRQNQYPADVTQENVERQKRNADVLDPNTQETRDNWYVTQVRNHERLFPFSDNLTTLMFIVVSDLSEAQRKRLTSPLSLQGMNVTAYTFEAVKDSVCGIVLYAETLNGGSFTPRELTRQQHEQNLHRGRLC